MYVWSSHIAEYDQPGKVANPARGQLNRENEHSPVPVRAWEFGLARRFLLRKACAARVNRRLRRYYLIVRRLPNVFALVCRS